jgi:hypothetical protein
MPQMCNIKFPSGVFAAELGWLLYRRPKLLKRVVHICLAGVSRKADCDYVDMLLPIIIHGVYVT